MPKQKKTSGYIKSYTVQELKIITNNSQFFIIIAIFSHSLVFDSYRVSRNGSVLLFRKHFWCLKPLTKQGRRARVFPWESGCEVRVAGKFLPMIELGRHFEFKCFLWTLLSTFGRRKTPCTSLLFRECPSCMAVTALEWQKWLVKDD